VVIGARALGAATAYLATLAGLRVEVVERGTIVSGTTSACKGNLLVSDKETGPELDLALLSNRLWRDDLAEHGPLWEFEVKGGLVVASIAAGAGRLVELSERQRAAGIEVQDVPLDQVRDYEPHLTRDIAGAAFCPQDCQVQPMLMAAHLLRMARSAPSHRSASLSRRSRERQVRPQPRRRPAGGPSGAERRRGVTDAGMRSWRTTPRGDRPRGLFCGIGICYDCLLTVDGQANQRACLVPVHNCMRLKSQRTTAPVPRRPARGRLRAMGRAGYDVAVVGAGPAGLAAAVTAAEHRLSVVLIDAAAQPGGQFWRHPDTSAAVEDEGRSQHMWRRFTELRDRLRALDPDPEDVSTGSEAPVTPCTSRRRSAPRSGMRRHWCRPAPLSSARAATTASYQSRVGTFPARWQRAACKRS